MATGSPAPHGLPRPHALPVRTLQSLSLCSLPLTLAPCFLKHPTPSLPPRTEGGQAGARSEGQPRARRDTMRNAGPRAARRRPLPQGSILQQARHPTPSRPPTAGGAGVWPGRRPLGILPSSQGVTDRNLRPPERVTVAGARCEISMATAPSSPHAPELEAASGHQLRVGFGGSRL